MPVRADDNHVQLMDDKYNLINSPEKASHLGPDTEGGQL